MNIIQEAYIESVVCYPYVTAAMREAALRLDPAATTERRIRSIYTCAVPEADNLLRTVRTTVKSLDCQMLDILISAFEEIGNSVMDPLCSVAAINPEKDPTEKTNRGSRDKLLAGRITQKEDCYRWADAFRTLRSRLPG